MNRIPKNVFLTHEINKISLFRFDDKIWILDDVIDALALFA